MKVYALIGGWDYEGNDEPVGIYSTREKAVEVKGKIRHGYDVLDVYEFEVDHTPAFRLPEND